MKFTDTNQWLKTCDIPEGFYFAGVDTSGAFLIVRFQQQVYWKNTNCCKQMNYLNIYLNSDGRPVGKLFDHSPVHPMPPAIPTVPVSGGKKILFGVKLVLRGFMELIKCNA